VSYSAASDPSVEFKEHEVAASLGRVNQGKRHESIQVGEPFKGAYTPSEDRKQRPPDRQYLGRNFYDAAFELWLARAREVHEKLRRDKWACTAAAQSVREEFVPIRDRRRDPDRVLAISHNRNTGEVGTPRYVRQFAPGKKAPAN
jgi:hypothetical protein